MTVARTMLHAEVDLLLHGMQIASLPHVEVRFADASGKEHSVLLMLDTGACGADVMLHGRCIKELQLDLGFEQAGR